MPSYLVRSPDDPIVRSLDYPIYVVIDRDGNIAGEQRGAAGEHALRRFLAGAGIQAPEKSDEDK